MKFFDEIMNRLKIYDNQDILHEAVLDELGEYIAGHAQAQSRIAGVDARKTAIAMASMLEGLLVTIADIGLPPKITEAINQLGEGRDLDNISSIQAVFEIVKAHHANNTQ
jgi:hypothetical protein